MSFSYGNAGLWRCGSDGNGWFQQSVSGGPGARCSAEGETRSTRSRLGGSGTKYGHLTVWLDSEHGYHPARIKLSAGDGDSLINDRQRYIKGDHGKEYLDNVRFEKIDGLWVPMEADSGHDRVMRGNMVKTDTHYKRTSFIRNPDHDQLGSFADPIKADPKNDPELRNGTRVVIDKSPRRYVWLDGKAIPDVKEKN